MLQNVYVYKPYTEVCINCRNIVRMSQMVGNVHVCSTYYRNSDLLIIVFLVSF